MTERRDPAFRVVELRADASVYGDSFGGWRPSVIDDGAGWYLLKGSSIRPLGAWAD
jgi:hypothetical protein